MARLLNVPVPIVAAALAIQLPGEEAAGPTWLLGFLAGVYVLVWVLEKFGLVGGKGERRQPSFTEEDRAALTKVANLLAHRDDDGVERFLAHAKYTRELGELSARIVDLLERQDATARDSNQALRDLLERVERKVDALAHGRPA